MWDLNTLSVRYYLEDVERAARHEIAERKHRERTGPFLPDLAALARRIGAGLAVFVGWRPRRGM